eukprot:TRINITY_DN341_c0_g3_i1.p3 TRINITY_DN341_c0_g3~~TRINITY_DN341_c0_g3_i1.p3  ORF type:complete len:282 (-),score=105.97 TRINITY_DN341_c0_g3_i1:75-920(-)
MSAFSDEHHFIVVDINSTDHAQFTCVKEDGTEILDTLHVYKSKPVTWNGRDHCQSADQWQVWLGMALVFGGSFAMVCIGLGSYAVTMFWPQINMCMKWMELNIGTGETLRATSKRQERKEKRRRREEKKLRREAKRRAREGVEENLLQQQPPPHEDAAWERTFNRLLAGVVDVVTAQPRPDEEAREHAKEEAKKERQQRRRQEKEEKRKHKQEEKEEKRRRKHEHKHKHHHQEKGKEKEDDEAGFSAVDITADIGADRTAEMFEEKGDELTHHTHKRSTST